MTKEPGIDLDTAIQELLGNVAEGELRLMGNMEGYVIVLQQDSNLRTDPEFVEVVELDPLHIAAAIIRVKGERLRVESESRDGSEVVSYVDSVVVPHPKGLITLGA